MNWFATIDSYCERTDASFWSEPLNAVSNGAFIFAGAFVLVRALRTGKRGAAQITLISLVALIGLGSFLFHTFATRLASLADVIPITVFIFGYFAYALSRFVRLDGRGTMLGTALFLGGSLAIERLFSPLIGSSAAYMPGLFAMLGIGGYLAAKPHPAGLFILSAGAVFAFSLGFRIADQPLCDSWPLGTHFLWHILNAAALTLLLLAALHRGNGVAAQNNP